jgi:hypothetical protein
MSQAVSPRWLARSACPSFLDHRHSYFDPVIIVPGMSETGVADYRAAKKAEAAKNDE